MLYVVLCGALQVYDSAASRSSWVDILGPEDESRHHLAAAASAMAAQQPNKLAPSADAAVQTDSSPTESAGSTAAAAAAADDDQPDFSSPRRGLEKGYQQQQHQASDGCVWSDAAAGSALLSAARQEIQRLQELNQQLLHSHAEGRQAGYGYYSACVMHNNMIMCFYGLPTCRCCRLCFHVMYIGAPSAAHDKQRPCSGCRKCARQVTFLHTQFAVFDQLMAPAGHLQTACAVCCAVQR